MFQKSDLDQPAGEIEVGLLEHTDIEEQDWEDTMDDSRFDPQVPSVYGEL